MAAGPLTHERVFRVRHYECDAYGHVNHANYLRYMQEAAFDASAAAGYGIDAYAALGQYWLVRESDITYLRPLSYGDSVVVKTWVADFRRVRSRRRYDFIKQDTGERVATAHSDWVYLDSTSLRPISVPQPMIQAFWPDGPPPEQVTRERFPAPPPPPPGAFRLRFRVRWRDIDAAGHVNNAVYLAYLEDCGLAICLDRGWPVARMMAAGFGIVARRYRIEYLLPALVDEELETMTWISDVRRATAVRHYAISRPSDRQLIARARATWVWIDLATGKPIRIPPDFLDDFRDNVSSEVAA